MDIDDITAVHRAVGSRRVGDADARTVVLTRRYDAPVADVWNAVTDPARLGRWFLPVTGDLRLGGTYQLEGNAGGEIVRCEPPRRFAVTWIYGEQPEGSVSEVEVRLAEVDGATELTLEHVATVPAEFWERYGPGAGGVGWDLGLVGLAAHLAGEPPVDPVEQEKSPEARAFMTASSEAWGAASTAAGIPADDVARMVANTTAFYVPPAE